MERKNKEQIEGLGLLSGGWKRECGGAILKETNWGFGGGNWVKRSKKKQIGGFEATKWYVVEEGEEEQKKYVYGG